MENKKDYNYKTQIYLYEMGGKGSICQFHFSVYFEFSERSSCG